jgi:hypothetical protein
MLGVVLGGFVSVMFGRLAVMVRGILVMLGRDLVMTAALVRLGAHVVLLDED